MKNKTFKANINIPFHLRFKSRYFQNFEYQEFCKDIRRVHVV